MWDLNWPTIGTFFFHISIYYLTNIYNHKEYWTLHTRLTQSTNKLTSKCNRFLPYFNLPSNISFSYHTINYCTITWGVHLNKRMRTSFHKNIIQVSSCLTMKMIFKLLGRRTTLKHLLPPLFSSRFCQENSTRGGAVFRQYKDGKQPRSPPCFLTNKETKYPIECFFPR